MFGIEQDPPGGTSSRLHVPFSHVRPPPWHRTTASQLPPHPTGGGGLTQRVPLPGNGLQIKPALHRSHAGSAHGCPRSRSSLLQTPSSHVSPGGHGRVPFRHAAQRDVASAARSQTAIAIKAAAREAVWKGLNMLAAARRTGKVWEGKRRYSTRPAGLNTPRPRSVQSLVSDPPLPARRSWPGPRFSAPCSLNSV
jgi:hypothetical protein